MRFAIKNIFKHYLIQLESILKKTPEPVFSASLAPGMFDLATNAKIACNFVLRGYCPLVGCERVSFDAEGTAKQAILAQLANTLSYLDELPEVLALQDDIYLDDRAGFADVHLPQPEFIHRYIIPNFMFHISMVYAIARANQVPVSKGDFDGIHSYPEGFSFLKK